MHAVSKHDLFFTMKMSDIHFFFLVLFVCRRWSDGNFSHFRSCNKFINESIASYIHCDFASMYIDSYGQVISKHNRDLSWNLNSLTTNLYKELKSWRNVYWRLWGMCHYLYCESCESYFPVSQVSQLRHTYILHLQSMFDSCFFLFR